MINAANTHGMTIAHPIMEARYDPLTGVGLLSVLVLVFDNFSPLFIFSKHLYPLWNTSCACIHCTCQRLPKKQASLSPFCSRSGKVKREVNASPEI
jgi:hypothetical protein